ncbi:MAG: V-type ATP synthase subunit D [Gammaproteobacteria bacterium]|nr:MAG: V-type ATP synthase subunit D [Gammaproteobacteria bacterium]
MAKLQLSKSALSKERSNLKTYQQFLPSLDLKRQELMSQRAKAKKALVETKINLEQLSQTMAEQIPMLSNNKVDLTELVMVKDVDLDHQNIMGAHLPVLKTVSVDVRAYSFLAKPQWVDGVAIKLKDLLTLQIQLQVEQQRLELLNAAVRTITQRVNLFDKVLIPKAQQNIKKIKIYLSDLECAAVVNAKLAKSKRLREAAL